MKRKFLSKILISFIVIAILLAPISPVFEKQNGQLALETKINKANAEDYSLYENLLNQSTFEVFGSFSGSGPTSASAGFNFEIIPGQGEKEEWKYVDLATMNTYQENAVLLTIFNTENKLIVPPTNLLDQKSYALYLTSNILNTISGKILVTKLTPDTNYVAKLYYRSETNGEGGGVNLLNSTKKDYYQIKSTPLEIKFKTPREGLYNGDQQAMQDIISNPTGENNNSITDITPTTAGYSFNCGVLGIDQVIGCIAGVTYFIWEVSAWIANMAGSFLDFFIYYSTNSDSYTSPFVTKGWGIIRDIANIFFIIALLYIAIKTILSLNVTNNKKLISAIIIIALLINFSLFFTEVIIDASNILAKVFYNQITSVDKNGAPLPPGSGGQKSISVGLIKGFNPQEIVSADMYDMSRGKFVFITLLLIALTLYSAYMFFVVAILFVSRVVSLWLAMIFAPLAFASYTVPFDIPGFGHKKWWDDLLKAAFLAPIFLFFLYIIVLFTDLGKEAIGYASNSQDFIQRLMKTIIPFSIIFILLMQAKKLAVDYSGQLGATLSKYGGMATGLVGGVALGAGALLARGTVGAGTSYLLRSKAGESIKSKAEEKGLGGFAARLMLKATTAATKSSFDARKSPLGGLAGMAGLNLTKGAQMVGLGVKEGGYQKTLENRNKKAMEEFETTKTKMTDAEVKTWNEKRSNRLKNSDGSDITTAEQLNNHRMQVFNDNIGKTGFVSSVAYTAVKTADDLAGTGNKIEDKAKANLQAINPNYTQKELSEEKEKILDERAKSTKLAIGVALAGATGGIGGIVGAGMIGGGVAGAMVGGLGGFGLGAGSVVGEGLKQQESERLTRAAMGRQIKTLGNIEEKLSHITEELGKNYDLLEKGNNITKDEKGNFVNLVKGNREQGFTIDEEAQTEITKALTKLAIAAEEEKLTLRKLINDKQDTTKTKERLFNNTIETARLEKLRTALKEVNTLKNQEYNFKKDKAKANTPTATTTKSENTPSFKSQPSTPPVTPPSTPSTPTK
ncbi:MAG: hypothetical protein WC264_03665 [Candidatus Paceibacterota bacterium]|jgi:hypothetical protein